jgi:predicted nuclease of predicted toxin-antitoxin system
VTEKNIKLRILLDEGVPISVGEFFESDGHEVIYFNQALTKGATDQVVCTVAEANDAILVACDSDMKGVARKQGISGKGVQKVEPYKALL